MNQFLGAVKTRIAQRQKQLWSRIIGCGFVAEDIKAIWPEPNMEFFAMKYSENFQSMKLSDLNLRELDEVHKWLTSKLEEANHATEQRKAE